jgi:hypothetical protein
MGGDNGKVLYDKIHDQFGNQVDENNKKLYNEAWLMTNQQYI